MKKIIFAVAGLAGLAGLAACGGGGGDHAAIVKACMEDGSSDQKTCDCMADSAQESLDKSLFSKLAKAAREGEESADAIMGDLTPAEQGQFMTFAMQAAMTCGMGE